MEKASRPEQRLIEAFGPGPVAVARAPGRVNLIGDHTDYNGGYVLPAAVDREVRIAFRPSGDGRVEIVSADFGDRASFDLSQIVKGQGPDWAKYPMGVAWALQAEKFALKGLRAAVQGNVPVGAGLSSSAAIEAASALAFCSVSGLTIHREKLALICQRAENEFVGMKCGIMDQYACLLGRKGCALFLDCSTLETDLVPLDEDRATIVVCDTRVKRQLINSPYNRRREECQEAFKILQRRFPDARSFRDISIAMFRSGAEDLSGPLQKRARHVVTEDARVLMAAHSLKKGDLIAFGALMDASHESLRNDFEVSCRELDLMVRIARDCEGVFGCRMTGAGFGGCVVALVRPNAADALTRKIAAEYRAETGIEPGVYVVRASEGATLEAANEEKGRHD